MTTMTTTERGADMNLFGKRLDKCLSAVSVDDGSEPWSQFDILSFFVTAEKDADGKMLKRKCACGQGLYQSFVLENRHTGVQVPSIGMSCIKNHFPTASYEKAKKLKEDYFAEKEFCNIDTVRDLEYQGKYRCCCRPCRKYGDDATERYCKSHREQCMKQAYTWCKFPAVLQNKCIKRKTWKNILAWYMEWNVEYLIWVLEHGFITCQYLRAYIVNEMLNAGYVLDSWKTDTKPVFKRS